MRLGGIVFDPRAEYDEVVVLDDPVAPAVLSAVQTVWRIRVERHFVSARSDLQRNSLAAADHLLRQVDADGFVQVTSRSLSLAVGTSERSCGLMLQRLCTAGLLRRLDDVLANDSDGGYVGMVRLYQLWGVPVSTRTPLLNSCLGAHPVDPFSLGEEVPLMPVARRDLVREPSPALRSKVLRRDGVCLACGAGCCLVADHVLPWSAGGKTILENLQTLCRVCNHAKGARYLRFDVPDVPVVPRQRAQNSDILRHNAHGYAKGCRCKICSAAKSVQQQRWRMKKAQPSTS